MRYAPDRSGLDQAEVAVGPPVQNRNPLAARVPEDEELRIASRDLENRLFGSHRLHAVAIRPDDPRRVERARSQPAPGAVSARAGVLFVRRERRPDARRPLLLVAVLDL